MDENKVTEPVVETTKTEEMIPKSQVSGIVAKESKSAIEKLLKDLGVEDVKSAKDGLAKFKEIQEAQKSDYDKLIEENTSIKDRLSQYEAKEKSQIQEDSIKSILKDMNIDDTNAKAINKLIGQVEEVTEELVTNTINEFLPNLVSTSKVKVGIDKKETIITSSTKDYLDKKYANNPYYKK